MKVSALRSSSGVALLVALAQLLSGVVSASGSSCARLTDAASPFRTSLSDFYQVQAVLTQSPAQELDYAPWEHAFASLDMLAPWLSQCVANVDAGSIAFELFTSEKARNCSAALDSSEMTQQGVSNELFAGFVCPLYTDILVPCINDVLVHDILVPAMDGAKGDCCSDMKSVILQSFGADLAATVESLTKLVGNAMCSTKTFTTAQGERETQNCGYALVAAIDSNLEQADSLEPILNALQIPTDQVCAAVTGKQFLLTSGQPAVFEPSADGSNYGICFQAMSDLVDHVSAYPLLKSLTVDGANGSVIALADLYEPNTCVPATELLSGLLAPDSFLMETVAVVNDFVNVLGVGMAEPEEESSSGGFDDDDGEDASDSGDWGESESDGGPAAEVLEVSTSHGRSLHDAATWTISIESDGSEASSDSDDDGAPQDETGSSSSETGDDEQGGLSLLPVVDATTAMINSTAAYVEQMPSDLCLHMPHGVACDYEGESIEFVYPEVASSASAPVAGAGASGLDLTNAQRRLALRAAANRLRRRLRQ